MPFKYNIFSLHFRCKEVGASQLNFLLKCIKINMIFASNVGASQLKLAKKLGEVQNRKRHFNMYVHVEYS